MNGPISTEFRIYINELGQQPIDLVMQVSISQDSIGRFHFESIREKDYASNEWRGRPCTVGNVEKNGIPESSFYCPYDYYEIHTYLLTTDDRMNAKQARYLVFIIYIPELNEWVWGHHESEYRHDGRTKYVIKERDSEAEWDNRAQPPTPVCGMDAVSPDMKYNISKHKKAQREKENVDNSLVTRMRRLCGLTL